MGLKRSTAGRDQTGKTMTYQASKCTNATNANLKAGVSKSTKVINTCDFADLLKQSQQTGKIRYFFKVGGGLKRHRSEGLHKCYSMEGK